MAVVGQLETFPALSRMSVAGGRPDEIRAKAEVVARKSVARADRMLEAGDLDGYPTLVRRESKMN